MIFNDKSPSDAIKKYNVGIEKFLDFLTFKIHNNEIKKPKCELCQKEHDYSYGLGRFCSAECARSFARSISKEETNKKISKAMKEKVKNGTHKGWPIRNKGVQSYPEKSWEKYFISLGLEDEIDYIKEYKINKKRDLGLDDYSNYFLDFLFISPDGIKIDIEIDGGQHEYADRKEIDKIRDKALRNNGFIVYRIPRININKSKQRKKMVKKQKEELINLFKKYSIL